MLGGAGADLGIYAKGVQSVARAKRARKIQVSR